MNNHNELCQAWDFPGHIFLLCVKSSKSIPTEGGNIHLYFLINGRIAHGKEKKRC